MKQSNSEEFQDDFDWDSLIVWGYDKETVQAQTNTHITLMV